jgi:acyl-coenzyme A synthetase/AMP-(fatty) acid ligase
MCGTATVRTALDASPCVIEGAKSSRRSCEEFGDKAALIDAPSGRTITYAQLVDSVRAVAAGLDERGFRKGEVFAHYAPNLPEYAVAFHAVATLGGINTTASQPAADRGRAGAS